jgi:hypothetical protein
MERAWDDTVVAAFVLRTIHEQGPLLHCRLCFVRAQAWRDPLARLSDQPVGGQSLWRSSCPCQGFERGGQACPLRCDDPCAARRGQGRDDADRRSPAIPVQ